MKKLQCIIYFLILSGVCFSQQTTPGIFRAEKLKIDRTALKVLGAYSTANVIYGCIASGQTQGSAKYFHQMNAIWNGITLGIISVGYFTKKSNSDSTLGGIVRQQQLTEKLFLFNSGLDLAYIAGGAYMYEKSKRVTRKPERLKGYGQSVMLQGAVLLLFDGIVYIVHNRHGKQLQKLLQKIELGATGNGVGVSVKL